MDPSPSAAELNLPALPWDGKAVQHNKSNVLHTLFGCAVPSHRCLSVLQAMESQRNHNQGEVAQGQKSLCAPTASDPIPPTNCIPVLGSVLGAQDQAPLTH